MRKNKVPSDPDFRTSPLCTVFCDVANVSVPPRQARNVGTEHNPINYRFQLARDPSSL